MNDKIWIVLFLVCLVNTTDGNPSFSVVETNLTICADAPSLTPIDDHVISGGSSQHIFYTLSGDTSNCFHIDNTTGIVYVMKDANDRKFNTTSIVLTKHSIDESGIVDEMRLIIDIASPVIHIVPCPKLLISTVREIAEINEEIDIAECWYKHNLPLLEDEYHITSISIRDVSHFTTLNPFGITRDGVIYVAKPLVFRNNINDMYIMNVTMMYLRGHGDPAKDCNRTETKITVKIQVIKSDCPVDTIQYEQKKNLFIDYQPLVVVPGATLEECKRLCSNISSCHSFNYNFVKKECRLLSETEYTLANATSKRLGIFLYRKFCKTEHLPSAALRRILDKVKSSVDFSAEGGIFLLQLLEKVVQKSKTTSLVNVDAMFTIIHGILNKTDISRNSYIDIKHFVEFCCFLIDMLIKIVSKMSIQEPTIKDSPLVIFDMLVKLLANDNRETWTKMNIVSNFTAINLVNIGNQNRFTMNIKTNIGTSGIAFEWPDEKIAGTNGTIVVVGMIERLGDLLSPTLVTKTDQNVRKFRLHGHVISAILNPARQEPFNTPLQLDIYTGHVKGQRDDSLCAYLVENGSILQNIWEVSGCWLVDQNETHTRCNCTHMTNFAVLMQVSDFEVSKLHSTSLELLTIIGCCISIIALSTTVVVLVWLRLRSERYVLLLHLSIAVILAQLVFLTGIDAVKIKGICRLVAILLHYLYLSVFTLMLAEGIHLFHKLHRAFYADDNLNLLLMLGWGTPFVIVSLSLLSSGDDYITERNCWLSTNGAIWAFVGPALTVITINVSILAIVIRTFLGVTIVAKKSDMQKFKASLKATMILLPLLGITWMFGVVAVNNSTVIFQYVFAILNSLQGLFIFLFHVVFNEEVRSACNIWRRHVVTSVDCLPPSPKLNGDKTYKAIQGTGAD